MPDDSGASGRSKRPARVEAVVYCGHLGIGLGVKGCRPAIPLALLLVAAFGCDWVEVCLMIARVPHTAMLSHSVPAAAAITAALVIVTFILRRSLTDALIVGGVSISHILTDWVTGRKPLWPGGPPMFGLHLYRFPKADFAFEAAFIIGGWLLYRRTFDSDRRNHPLLILLLVVLLALQAVFDWRYAS